MRRDQWAHARFPNEVDRAERLKKALTAFDRGTMLFRQHMFSLADQTAVELAEASEHVAEAAVAAAKATQ
jgi:hypothetical protein